MFRCEVLALKWEDTPPENVEHKDGVVCAVLGIAKQAETWYHAKIIINCVKRMVCVVDEDWAKGE